MIPSMRQTTEYWLQMLLPSLTMCVFIGFAFSMGSMIVLSIIPIYIENKSLQKANFILTTARISNYTLQMNRSIKRRDLTSTSNITNTSTLINAQITMNSSIQSALQQQLKNGDNRDKFNIYILNIISYTSNPSNMSVTLDFLIIYQRECLSCNNHRQSIIFKQLCSNNQLKTPIRFLIQYTNQSYVLSDPTLVYTPNILIGNISVITQIVSASQFVNLTNIIQTSSQTKLSNKFLVNNYTFIVTATKNNYFATLDEVNTGISANQNDGPVPLAGAHTMYSAVTQIIERQIQVSNGSNVVNNVTINDIILQFWYSNSTVHVIVNFLINYSMNCDNQCSNQQSIQLGNLTNTQIYIQPGNLTDGQIRILRNGVSTLFGYSLTTQVIANFTGTIIQAIPPTFTAVY